MEGNTGYGFYIKKIEKTAHNRSVYASALKRLGLRKTAVGLRPWCGFVFATVWAGVNASHRPITCPNRRKQPERYAT